MPSNNDRMPEARWKIERRPRAWGMQEISDRLHRCPAKIELIQGKLFFREEDRLTLLAMLLENVGTDAAVRLGDPEVWRASVAALSPTEPATDTDDTAR